MYKEFIDSFGECRLDEEKWNKLSNIDLDLLLFHSDCDDIIESDDCDKILKVINNIDFRVEFCKENETYYIQRFNQFIEMLQDKQIIYFD